MRALASAAVGAALMALGVGAASAACPPHKTRDCLVDLTLAPAASRQIVAGDTVPTPAAKAPPAAETPAYSGPTIGAAPNLGRAPEIGYRWSIN